MDKRINAKKLLSIGLLATASIGMVSCSSADKPKGKQQKDSIFDLDQRSTTTKKTSKTTTSVLSESEKRVVEARSKEILKDISRTGTFNSFDPGSYLSDTYEFILGGDSNTLVPKSELSNPENSDLSALDFGKITGIANQVAQAYATGVGASSYSSFINANNPALACTNFKIEGSGAIFLPVPGETWYKSIVIYEADCPVFPYESGATEVQITQLDIFFKLQIGSYTPYTASQLPVS